MKAIIPLLLLSIYGEASGTFSPIITTKSGDIRGLVVEAPASPVITQSSVTVYQFTAIPYATPPLGQLRFKKTQPVKPWNETLDATKLPNACSQHSTDIDGAVENGDEDCLFLNIWVPKSAFDTNQTLGVFVFIHGGSFSEGSSKESTYNGTVLAGYNDIIVVTINFRLGSLGFGYLGNDEVPGNMGLWDQLEALRWINENIWAFGGNESEVTIAGERSGAASVTSHLVSPYSRKYFQRAIIQSGSSNAAWGCHKPEIAQKVTNVTFAKICNRSSGQMECLRSTSADQFPLANADLHYALVYESVFTPVIDGDFIPRDPMEMLLAGNYSKVTIMIGANRDEGSAFVMLTPAASGILPSFGSSDGSLDLLTYDNYNALLLDRFKYLGNDPLIMEAISLQYWPRNKGQEIFKAVSDADGDFGMLCPTYAWANATSKSSKVFAYYFTQRRSQHWAPDYLGVLHSDELSFMFGELFAEQTAGNLGSTDEEKQLSQVIMTYWSNFVKYGDPNGQARNASQLHSWPSFTGKTCSEQYFELNVANQVTNQTDTEAVICGLKTRECLFWEHYIVALADKLSEKPPTCPTQTPATVVCPTTTASLANNFLATQPVKNAANPNTIFSYFNFIAILISAQSLSVI